MHMFKKLLFSVLLTLATSSNAQYLDGPLPDAHKLAGQVQNQVQQLQQVHVPARKFDPLRIKVIMQFPANVKTVQQAAQYLLETAKYKLVMNPADPEASRQILSRALLPQDADGSLQTIENALLTIGGDDTILIIDRANKLISFEFLSQ